MNKLTSLILPLLAVALSACASAKVETIEDFDVSYEEFEAIEPTVLGLIAAPTIWEALAPVARQTPESNKGDQQMKLFIRKSDEGYVADVVKTGLLDDTVEAEHIRLDLRLEPEGWFITNAWRRYRCYRGPDAGVWATQACN